MKLSGHSFDNEVFNSLLDGMAKNIELKKTADGTPPPPDVQDFFSATTAQNINDIHSEELEFIASELAFAAENSKVAITSEDLAKFASQIQKENLRGKKLERAARKYCSNLDRMIAPPTGSMHLSGLDLINQLAQHKVMPAGYNPDHGADNSRTGKYMGSIRNPNTIWDTEAMQRQAQIQLGDEQIKASKEAQTEYKAQLKEAQWNELHEQHSDPNQVHDKTITNAGISGIQETVSQKLPANTMSMFSTNRDFENIPENTIGEEIIAKAEARANKKLEANADPRDIQRPMNTKDVLDKLF